MSPRTAIRHFFKSRLGLRAINLIMGDNLGLLTHLPDESGPIQIDHSFSHNFRSRALGALGQASQSALGWFIKSNRKLCHTFSMTSRMAERRARHCRHA
jgi:hypothetical protein